LIDGQSHNTSAVATKAPHGKPKDCIRGQEIVGKLLVQRDEIEAALVRLLNGSCLSPAAVSRFPIVGVREQYRPTFPVSAATALPAMGSPWLEGADCHPSDIGTCTSFGSTCPGAKSAPLGGVWLSSLAFLAVAIR